MIKQLISNPHYIFLVDCLGALLTSILTLFLTQVGQYIGMPHPALVALAGVALLYSGYSFICYKLMPIKWRTYLKIITLANALYCCTTLVLLFYFHDVVTAWDWAYFISEIVIVCILIYVEYKLWSLQTD